MRRLLPFLSTALLTLGWPVHPGQVVQLADGTVYFNSPPRLLGASTTFNAVYVWGATYYFNLQMPDNAGEPLQKVTIAQQEGGDDIRFELNDSQADVADGDGKNRTRIPVQATVDRKTNTVTVLFSQPVPAGKQVRIALRPVRNPSYSGVYLFGVTAFPQGDKSYGQFLGYGRLQFYDRGSDSFIFRFR